MKPDTKHGSCARCGRTANLIQSSVTNGKFVCGPCFAKLAVATQKLGFRQPKVPLYACFGALWILFTFVYIFFFCGPGNPDWQILLLLGVIAAVCAPMAKGSKSFEG